MPSISGQKTVTAAGTAERLGTGDVNGALLVRALDSNSAVIAIGNDGANDVTLSNGMRLAAGEAVVFDFVGNLASLWIDSTVNGEGVCWLALNV